MTLTLDLSPEEETRLRELAQQQRQDIKDKAHDLLRVSLGITPPPDDAAKQAALIQRLQAAGLLTILPTQPLGPPPRPITVLGPPVSQTLLEDREQ